MRDDHLEREAAFLTHPPDVDGPSRQSEAAGPLRQSKGCCVAPRDRARVGAMDV